MTDTTVTLKPVTIDDLELLLAWRSNPEVYSYFETQKKPLEWGDHLEWFASRGDDRHDYIIQYAGRRVGVVSVTEENYVSIYIGEVSLWGSGVAKATLKALTEQLTGTLYARIHRDNERSIGLFKSIGFTRRKEDDEWCVFEYTDV